MAAVNSKSVEMCKKYIHYAGKKDTSGTTALMYAADAGELEIVKYLFDSEAGILTESGESSLHFAIRRNN